MDRPFVPFAWFEKIALLLLAADLEAQGWPLVRLSVAPSVLTERGAAGGTDWARAVKAARDRGRASRRVRALNVGRRIARRPSARRSGTHCVEAFVHPFGRGWRLTTRTATTGSGTTTAGTWTSRRGAKARL